MIRVVIFLVLVGLLALGVRGHRLHGRFVPLEQRVALEFGLHEGAQFNVGELKQTNGLLQLGCHHQLLALSQF